MNFLKKSLMVILTTTSINSYAQIGIGLPSEPPVNNGPVNAADCIAQQDLKDIAGHFSQFSNLTGQDFCK